MAIPAQDRGIHQNHHSIPNPRFIPWLASILLIGLTPAWLSAGTVTGAIQVTSTGRAVPFGTLTFTLSQPAVVSGTATVVTTPVNCFTDGAGNVVGVPSPVSAPALSSNTTGSLPAGTYFVRYTWGSGGRETLPSPEASVTLSQAGSLIVSVPSNPQANATQWNIYIGTSANGETLQDTVNTPFNNDIRSTNLTGGTALPAANNTACSLRFNDELQPSFTGYVVTLVTSTGATVSGFPQKWYLSGGSSGTINVSSGTPLYQGTVVYPQAIVTTPAASAQQSIGGPLSLGSFGMTVGDGTASFPAYSFTSETGTGFQRTSAGQFSVNVNGSHKLLWDNTQRMSSTFPLCWSSAVEPFGNPPDSCISRISGNVLGVGNAQADFSGLLKLAGIGLNGANGSAGAINGASGWVLQASGTTVAGLTPTSFNLSQPLVLNGTTSGSTTIQPAAVASGTLALPATTGIIATINNAQSWSGNQANVALVSPSIGGETLTAAPRFQIVSMDAPNSSITANIFKKITLDKAVTITRIDVTTFGSSAAGCTTPAIIRLSDGTTNLDTSITNGASFFSTPFSQNYAAGAILSISAVSGTGCTTAASGPMVSVQGKMQ